MSQSLICYACSRPAVEVSGVVQECECGCRKMVAAPYRAPMNLTERCARAEALAERLAWSLHNARSFVAEAATGGDSTARLVLPTLIASLNAWQQHRADLETLEGKA